MPGDHRLRWLTALLFLLALYLRTSGLSHDLDTGAEYHPDTLKQMMATKMFLNGHYYFVIGNPDYDGYPLFNSHLVEYLWRAYEFARGAVLAVVGAEPTPAEPSYIPLLWLTRTLNAVLSSLAVVVVLLAGVETFGLAVGIIAALLLAFSPADVTMAHYAMGDSTAAFLATCALFFAFRVFRRGALWDYVWGGFFAAAAFSAKYHAGLSLLPILLAHVFRFAGGRELLSRRSIGRIALLACSALGGLLVTSPALLVYPERAFKDILHFLEYTSDFGMSDAEREMGLPQRFLLSMSRNLPVFYNGLGPVAAFAALASLGVRFRHKAIWVAAVAPLFYLLVALTLKPISPPFYITVVTPALFLSAACALAWPLEWRRARPIGALVSSLLSLAAVLYVADYARRELFFFRQTDTRRSAQAWAEDSIPPIFSADSCRYSITTERWEKPEGTPAPAFHALAGEDVRQPPGTSLLAAFAPETGSDSLYRFGRLGNFSDHARNKEIRFFLEPNALISSNYSLPAWQTIPANRGGTVVYLDAPDFCRTPRAFELDAEDSVDRVLATTNTLRELVIALRSGFLPAEGLLEVGGRRTPIRLQHRETRLLRIPDPRPVRRVSDAMQFYRFRFRTTFGRIRATLLTRPEEITAAAFNAGDFQEAFRVAESIPADRHNLSVDALRLITGLLSGALTPEQAATEAAARPDGFPSALAPRDLMARFGISREYLDALPYLSFDTRRSASNRLLPIADPPPPAKSPPLPPIESDELGSNWVQGASIMLEPGCYALTAGIMGKPRKTTLELLDPLGTVLPQRPGPDITPQGGVRSSLVVIPFEITADMREVCLRLVADGHDPLEVNEFRVNADPVATVNATLALLHSLLAAGTSARPAEPDSGRSRHGELRSCRVVFPGVANLTGYRIGPNPARQGEPLHVALYWEPVRLSEQFYNMAVWVHFIDAAGRRAPFPMDREFARDLCFSAGDDALNPRPLTAIVPRDLPPGTYQVAAGLYTPMTRKSIVPASSDLPRHRKGVVLGEVTIEPAADSGQE